MTPAFLGLMVKKKKIPVLGELAFSHGFYLWKMDTEFENQIEVGRIYGRPLSYGCLFDSLFAYVAARFSPPAFIIYKYRKSDWHLEKIKDISSYAFAGGIVYYDMAKSVSDGQFYLYYHGGKGFGDSTYHKVLRLNTELEVEASVGFKPAGANWHVTDQYGLATDGEFVYDNFQMVHWDEPYERYLYWHKRDALTLNLVHEKREDASSPDTLDVWAKYLTVDENYLYVSGETFVYPGDPGDEYFLRCRYDKNFNKIDSYEAIKKDADAICFYTVLDRDYLYEHWYKDSISEFVWKKRRKDNFEVIKTVDTYSGGKDYIQHCLYSGCYFGYVI